MKIVQTFLLIIIFSASSYSQLNTKLIASKYGKGVVKIILMDPKLEEIKPGSGYLSRGSGFFVTNDGYIFTNRHVVETCVKGYVDYDYKDNFGQKKSGIAHYSDDLIANKNFIKAYNTGYTMPVIQVFHGTSENDYKLYAAEVVAIGMGPYDGALLKVITDEKGNTKNFNFTSLPLGNSDNVEQGEQFCVFGYPAQFRGKASQMLKDMSTLSMGIMSGYDYVLNKDYGYLKTDAEIHPGNSGGPVFNEKNEVIGIATAKGAATGIGLIGGINGMYYVSAVNGDAHKRLLAKGLTPPERSSGIETVSGNKLPMRTATEINTLLNVPKSGNQTITPNKIPTSTSYYKNAKVYFSNISVKDNNNKLPEISKQYSYFTIDRKKGGVAWVYVDNYPTAINSKQIKVFVDKFKNGKYKKFKDEVYTINSTSDFTHFAFTFYEKGTFRFSIYSKENAYISSGTLVITYN